MVRVLSVPLPARTPAVWLLVGWMISRLVPKPAICAWMSAWEPRPSAIRAMTAPTPMMTPSMVSRLRSLLRAMLRRAAMIRLRHFMTGRSR